MSFHFQGGDANFSHYSSTACNSVAISYPSRRSTTAPPHQAPAVATLDLASVAPPPTTPTLSQGNYYCIKHIDYESQSITLARGRCGRETLPKGAAQCDHRLAPAQLQLG
ncbi:hypothetical protein CDL15_Pgr010173 [Punica granatum]|nr:hypothetical protein CDL15_Pgr010173 [Punica granatum]